jgi:hypothetical protein
LMHMEVDEPPEDPPQDWLSPLMVKLGSAPLDLQTLASSSLCSTLDLHASVYTTILQDSLTKSNSLSLLSQYSTGLAYTLTKAFGTWSLVLRPSRNATRRTCEEVVAFARCAELGGRVAALLFSREARDVIDGEWGACVQRRLRSLCVLQISTIPFGRWSKIQTTYDGLLYLRAHARHRARMRAARSPKLPRLPHRD